MDTTTHHLFPFLFLFFFPRPLPTGLPSATPTLPSATPTLPLPTAPTPRPLPAGELPSNPTLACIPRPLVLGSEVRSRVGEGVSQREVVLALRIRSLQIGYTLLN